MRKCLLILLVLSSSANSADSADPGECVTGTITGLNVGQMGSDKSPSRASDNLSVRIESNNWNKSQNHIRCDTSTGTQCWIGIKSSSSLGDPQGRVMYDAIKSAYFIGHEITLYSHNLSNGKCESFDQVTLLK